MRIFLVGGCLVIALALWVIYLWYWNNEASGPVYEKYYIKTEKEEDWVKRFIGDPVALFTFVLTCATIGLYLATRQLWNATERLVRGADDTALRQLRAYVSIESGGVTYIRSQTHHGLVVSIVFGNSGNTPAYKFTTGINGGIFDSDASPFANERFIKNPQRSILGPMAKFNINCDPAWIDEASMNQIRLKKSSVFYWGSAQYEDFAGNSRFFIFRVVATGSPATMPNGDIGWALAPHGDGYEAN